MCRDSGVSYMCPFGPLLSCFDVIVCLCIMNTCNVLEGECTCSLCIPPPGSALYSTTLLNKQITHYAVCYNVKGV